MRNCIVILSAFALAACAAPSAPPAPLTASSPGQQLSSNLLNVHEMYCIRSAEANRRLAELKTASPTYRVVDRNTGEASNVWVLVPPKVQASGGQTLVQWGFSVREFASGGSCGVAYLRPEQLETLKSGYLP